ncbi:hypothetical protein [Microvirga roseola]|uniref:hypothetical protein n=1 Tax=Microvirga roseola TaxID=2883126 RepID=UPI001E42A2D4|nr:hypothetical protein [Microvirga roseola]
MSMIRKTSFAAVAVAAGLIAAPALYAQGAPSGNTNSMPGTMDHGAMMGSGGMMGGDMGSMMQMMENCNRMMQAMNDQNAPNPSRETPPVPGQRG